MGIESNFETKRIAAAKCEISLENSDTSIQTSIISDFRHKTAFVFPENGRLYLGCNSTTKIPYFDVRKHLTDSALKLIEPTLERMHMQLKNEA